MSGRLFVRAQFRQGPMFHVVLARPRRANPPSSIERVVLEEVLAAAQLATVADSRGVTIATVHVQARAALLKVGLHSREGATRIRMASRFRQERGDTGAFWLKRTEPGGRMVYVLGACVSVDRLERLSKAEQLSVLLLLEGNTNAGIAGARGLSTRTIANQLRSAFGKLEVGGRLQLVKALFEQSTPLSPS